MSKYLKYLFVLTFLTLSYSYSQIKITPLPQNKSGIFDQAFFDKNDFREVILLNSGWQVFAENNPESKVSITIPAVFEGDEELIFEKKISLTVEQIHNSQIMLGFLGLNYSAEFFLNGYNIFKYGGGSIPFEVPLPKDILKENSVITVKINRRLNSTSTIPVVERFLFSNLSGGIFREVYLKIISPLHISYNTFAYSLDQSLTKTSINFKIGIQNSALLKSVQGNQPKDILVRINILQGTTGLVLAKGDFLQTITSENSEALIKLELQNPQLWSPQTPNYYLCEISLLRDGQVIDKTINTISFYLLQKGDDKLLLNKNQFTFQGTTYFLDETSLRKNSAYQKIKDDLTLIKNTGFNSVRFAKSYPHPYTLKICRELGLFAFIELPLNSVPEEIIQEHDFQLRSVYAVKEFASSYAAYGNTFIIGTGSSFLPNSEITQNFIESLSSVLKENGFLTYASFIGIQTEEIKNLDFYGIELYSSPINSAKEELKKAVRTLKENSVFISETTYPNYKGDLSGYMAKNSSDAQAKYFGDIITLSREIHLSGFMINSLFDYNGVYTSLYGGYSNNNIYKFGVLGYSRDLNCIPYKVINAKLTTNAKVTIPIGSGKEDSSIIFIFTALFLSIIMAVLINTKKKFREDCTRSLLRPYNFFADIRDHRIISGVHTAILMLIQAGSISLLFTILFSFFRSNILLEKILLSFGSEWLMKFVSYIAWNPIICFAVLFLVVMVKFAILSLIIKSASFFMKTKVELPSIFFGVIWTFLPFTLLLPLELILYKAMALGTFNSIITVFLILFTLWILQRLIKGIYVIFDARPFYVYVYSILVILVCISGLFLKFQLTHSTLYYILNSIKQYKAMIF